ncbi:hypothetical protein ACE8EZ_17715 [Pantoea deleyi]|uniref:hypothetical protein n=1 Tax=Pantoea deleyi TaxID=470932 RepID=UPI0035D4D4E5
MIFINCMLISFIAAGKTLLEIVLSIEKNPFFRDASQSITWLSASLHSRRCIFEQEKTGKEERNERLFSAAEAGWPPQQPLTTSN